MSLIMKDFYTIKEFAGVLGISIRTVYRMIHSKTINAFRIGSAKQGPWRIPHTEINKLAEINYNMRK